jgi:hypothetical protein
LLRKCLEFPKHSGILELPTMKDIYSVPPYLVVDVDEALLLRHLLGDDEQPVEEVRHKVLPRLQRQVAGAYTRPLFGST